MTVVVIARRFRRGFLDGSDRRSPRPPNDVHPLRGKEGTTTTRRHEEGERQQDQRFAVRRCLEFLRTFSSFSAASLRAESGRGRAGPNGDDRPRRRSTPAKGLTDPDERTDGRVFRFRYAGAVADRDRNVARSSLALCDVPSASLLRAEPGRDSRRSEPMVNVVRNPVAL